MNLIASYTYLTGDGSRFGMQLTNRYQLVARLDALVQCLGETSSTQKNREASW